MRPRYFDFETPELMIQGIPISKWAETIGRTPFYLYDRQVIEKKILMLRQNLPSDIQLHYAVKANPMSEILQWIEPLVDGFDVASGGELAKILKIRKDPSEISFAGPGKTDAELLLALRSGILLHVESLNEIYRVSTLSKSVGIQPRIALRVNPAFELKSGGMRMSGGPKAFGIDVEMLPEVFRKIEQMSLSIEGLHIFSGSQSLNTESICENHRQCFQLLSELRLSVPNTLRTFNFGGGFGIPYSEGETEIDLSEISLHLHRLMPAFRKQFPLTRAVIELGRYLVGESGIYTARIVDKKISRGETFLILDGGMNHHLAASGNLGQIIKRPFPMVIGNRLQSPTTELVNVVGPLCTPLDSFARQVRLSSSEIGDLLVIFQSGAYGLSSSPTQFLSHESPSEVLV